MSVSVAAAEANERCHKVEQKFVPWAAKTLYI